MTDTTAFTRQYLTPDKLRVAAREAVALATPQTLPGARNLIYILSQSARIGHFGMETQIVRTLYEASYDRIVIVAGALHQPGTNPWIPHCAGPKIRFVHTGDLAILLLGQVEAGLQTGPACDVLFAQPRTMITRFYRHILAGGTVEPLTLAEPVEARARTVLARHGVDPDAPFVLFHNRTLAYDPVMAYHGYRTAEVTSYRSAIARLIDAGYRVIRLGEPGLDPMGFDPDVYANVPDWADRDPAVDLFVLARCAFGVAQNSGPIWVAAAFGRPVLRTNTPFELLNLPYNDDISLFKRYRRTGSRDWMTYREILDAGLPAMFQDADLAAAGVEIVANTPDELLAATEEALARVAGHWRPDTAHRDRFHALGRDYEARIAADPVMRRRALDFYGYAHPPGHVARAYLDGHPEFLD